MVKRSSPWSYYYQTTLAYNVEDFELVNQYMFITKNVTVSYKLICFLEQFLLSFLQTSKSFCFLVLEELNEYFFISTSL